METIPHARAGRGAPRALLIYSQSLRGCPPLEPEVERDIALRYFETRDPVLAGRLVTANLRLVAAICREYHRSGSTLLDLIQEGNLGLVLAVQKFDPHRGVKLSSYAVWWIKSFVLKFIVANCRLVKVGTTRAQRKVFFNLGKERGKLDRSGNALGSKGLASVLGVPERDLIETELRLANADRSLDAPADARDEQGSTMVDLMPDLAVHRPDFQTEHRELLALLAARVAVFRAAMKDPREIDIFDERIAADVRTTLRDIAVRYGVCGERVRRIEEQLKSKLRVFLQTAYGGSLGPSDVA